ncbi:MAG: hypothetical protein IKQ69_06525 [Oscillospiraceae bacterium]|nr:hypothetical protein [Oscillospiraceae bacterium]
MARRKDSKPRRRHEIAPAEISPAEFSLEDILSEYRQFSMEPETAAPEAPPSEPIALEPEEDGVLTARVPASTEQPRQEMPDPAPEESPEEAAEPDAPAPDMPPEDVLDELYAPEELKPWREPEENARPARAGRTTPEPPENPELPENPEPSEIPEPSELSDIPEPSETTAAPEAPETAETPLTDEGYGDDTDFYAGPVEAKGEESDAFADAPGGPESPDRPGRAPTGGTLERIWKKISGLLAMESFKREQRRRQAPPEPENADKEMAPDKAARYYAAQMPALRLRSFGALGVCVLLSWLSVGSGLGLGIPGSLATDVRLAAMVLLVGQITVMLLALDVVTAGIMSLFRGRPGAESLLAVASLASVADTVAIILSRNGGRGIPYGAVTSLGLFFALRGAWHNAGGYHDSFLALFQSAEPVTLSQEELPERRGKVLVTARRETKGFIRRSEEPGEAELLATAGFFPMLLSAATLSLAAAVGSGDIGAFFHVFALMTAVCAGFGWLFSYPFLFSKAAHSLMVRGSALAGWTGAREMGTGRRLVIRDTDIFPEDTVEITGIRLLDKSRAQHIIACAGTMLSTAGTGTAVVFTELMRRHKAAMQTVEDFSVGEGGCKGVIQYQEVRVGSVGYMYLSGVKVPDKLKANNAVYIAIDGELSGVFHYRYRPMGSVQRALYTMRRKRRKPLVLARDFNIDPLLVRQAFGVSTEGFEFPPFPERYKLAAALTDGKRPVAGVMAREGLDLVVDLAESGSQLYQLGRICAWAALASAVLGMVLMLIPCWLGNWAAASAWRVLAYGLLWLLPALISRLLLQK